MSAEPALVNRAAADETPARRGSPASPPITVLPRGREPEVEELMREIARVEAELMRCEAEIEARVAGDDAGLGGLFRIRTERLQLEAYLRGLRFCLR